MQKQSGKQNTRLECVSTTVLTASEVRFPTSPKLIHPSFTNLEVHKSVRYLHPPKVFPSGLQTLKSKAKGKVKPFPRVNARVQL